MRTAMTVGLLFLAAQLASPSHALGGHSDGLRTFHIADPRNPEGTSDLVVVNDCMFDVEFEVEVLTQGEVSFAFPVVLGPGESFVREIRNPDGTAHKHVHGYIKLQVMPATRCGGPGRGLRAALATNDASGKTQGMLQASGLRSDGELVQAAPARGGSRELVRVGVGQRLEATVLNTCHLPVMAGVEITDLATGMTTREVVMVQPGDIGVLLLSPHAADVRWINLAYDAKPVPKTQGACPPGQGGLPGSTALRDDNDSITNPTMVEYGLLLGGI